MLRKAAMLFTTILDCRCRLYVLASLEKRRLTSFELDAPQASHYVSNFAKRYDIGK